MKDTESCRVEVKINTVADLYRSLLGDVKLMRQHIDLIERGVISDPCPECRRKDLAVFEARADYVRRLCKGEARDSMMIGPNIVILGLVSLDPESGNPFPGYAEMMEAGATLLCSALAALIEDGRKHPEKLTEEERKWLEKAKLIQEVAKA